MQDVCENLSKMTIAHRYAFSWTFFSRNIASFSHFPLYSFSRRNAKFREKVCEIRTKNESARSKKNLEGGGVERPPPPSLFRD